MIKFKHILFIASLFYCGLAGAETFQAVDGDSLASGTRRIRLDNIDAPEFTQICYDSESAPYSCGLEALKYLENLIKNAEIKCDCLFAADIYDREICECFADGISLNKSMVLSGFAITYRSEKFLAAENEAKLHKRGIWRGKFMRPALFRALERVKQKNAEAD